MNDFFDISIEFSKSEFTSSNYNVFFYILCSSVVIQGIPEDKGMNTGILSFLAYFSPFVVCRSVGFTCWNSAVGWLGLSKGRNVSLRPLISFHGHICAAILLNSVPHIMKLCTGLKTLQLSTALSCFPSDYFPYFSRYCTYKGNFLPFLSAFS